MKVIKETIGDTTILIQALDVDLEVVNGTNEGPALIDTGIEDRLLGIYAQGIVVIKNIAESVAEEINGIPRAGRPKQVEIEFTMGLSAQAGIWVLTGKGEHTFSVKMTWNLENDPSS